MTRRRVTPAEFGAALARSGEGAADGPQAPRRSDAERVRWVLENTIPVERWERREHEADMRDHDDREPDPLGGIYRDDEPQEWRA